MHPVTELLFTGIPNGFAFDLAETSEALEDRGIAVQAEPPFHLFGFTDEHDFRGYLCSGDGAVIDFISFAVAQPGGSWDNWSRAKEMKCLAIQQHWLEARKLHRPSSRHFSVENRYDERSASAAITIRNLR